MRSHGAPRTVGDGLTPRRRCRPAAKLLLLTALVAASASTAAGPATATNAAVPPFDQIPVGPAPTAVPYGIGVQLYHSGNVSDLSAAFTSEYASRREFDWVVGSGANAYTQFHSVRTDCAVVIGRITATMPWRNVATALDTCGDRFDLSTEELVGTPATVKAVRSDGTVYATYPRTNTPGPGPAEAPADRVGAAGKYFVVEERRHNGATLQGVHLWHPGDATTQHLPDNYAAVGRLGVGWLGARLDKLCWKTAPATNPLALRTPTLCSMAKPLLSADGTRAVLVKSGRVQVVDATTGAAVSQATMPAITEWQLGNREAVPAAWENTDSYLIEAKYDGALALVRCSASTGACNRAVRSAVRAGVTSIVTERGSADAVVVSAPAQYPAKLHDFNGDNKRDIAVWRPSNGTWYIRGLPTVAFGAQGDIPAAADFTGDGRTDIAVFRPSNGTWYIRGKAAVQFGQSGDVPVAGDYTGDRLADIAVWRPANGTWYVPGHSPVQWGAPGDVPMRGDFDADGFVDYAVWRPSNGTWYIRRLMTVRLGRSGDLPVAADYTGDDRTDIALWRPSTGVWDRWGDSVAWGMRGDVPVEGDYDGDKRADIAVWRPSNGTWYIRGIGYPVFGQAGDRPV